MRCRRQAACWWPRPLLDGPELPARGRAAARPRRRRRARRGRSTGPLEVDGRRGAAGWERARDRARRAVPGRPGRARLGARPGGRARATTPEPVGRAPDRRLARAGRPRHPADGRGAGASRACGSSPGTPAGAGPARGARSRRAPGTSWTREARRRVHRRPRRRCGGGCCAASAATWRCVSTYPERPRSLN